MQIYLDYSATTPCRPEAMAKMQAVLTDTWGNPASLHQWGERAAWVMEEAREQVARLIGADPTQILFTSGGTEADNLAIYGITGRYAQPQHLIISSVEHSAIAAPAQQLTAQGWEVTTLPVDAQGRVHPEDLVQSLRPNTVLISIIYGQSEIGTVQPIQALGSIARDRQITFHTDAVQAAGRIPLDVQSLPVDLLSLSSHKLYGPQGAGALYVRAGVKLHPPLQGGGQEQGLRPGTPSLPTLAGFGVAAHYAAQELVPERDRLIQLRERLFAALAEVPDLYPTGDRQDRLPHHLSFCLKPPQGDPPTGRYLVRQMNLAGIGISAGSACNSGKTLPSRVLKALGLPDAIARSGIRLTLGRDTTAADIDWTAQVLRQILARDVAAPGPAR
ncbi:cysteine desulfurase family protein [Lyngbya confervoides]|uniref:cysteine desulfurase n=1 Tax=Lyngbya confervoides BDU141951 TaxID=1574623 RepID=A0ABD4T8B9_9CYAN|nr:cysteine desulfurase family protein [Lyngbya confervoides]MCM1984871.1 cysteine desulfurase [Lyngbya confervoides BDU141951]